MSADQKGTTDKATKAKTELDATKTYSIIGLKGAKHISEGVQYDNIPGADAQSLIDRGYAKLA